MEKIQKRIEELQALLPELRLKNDALHRQYSNAQKIQTDAATAWMLVHDRLNEVETEIKYLKTFLENK